MKKQHGYPTLGSYVTATVTEVQALGIGVNDVLRQLDRAGEVLAEQMPPHADLFERVRHRIAAFALALNHDLTKVQSQMPAVYREMAERKELERRRTVALSYPHGDPVYQADDSDLI